VGDKHFLGGASPNRADLAVFGILRAVPTTKTFELVMTKSRIMTWYQRMVETVGESTALEKLPDVPM
jgi:microsomal prostaglandin-E synthase 2